MGKTCRVTAESVFLVEWYEGLRARCQRSMGRDYWRQLMAVRAAVNKMETRRGAGNQSGSLDAR